MGKAVWTPGRRDDVDDGQIFDHEPHLAAPGKVGSRDCGARRSCQMWKGREF